MKKELIKLAKALKLSGYKSYSSRIFKISEDLGADAFEKFDERYKEYGKGSTSVNYYPTYAQIANLIEALEDADNKNFLIRTFLSGKKIGLISNLGDGNESHYLNKAKVGFQTNVSPFEIREMIAKDIINKREHVGLPLDTYESMPKEIVIKYLIVFKEIDFGETSKQTSFLTLDSKLTNNEDAMKNNFKKYIHKEYLMQSEELDSGDSAPPRFNYKVNVKYLPSSNLIAGTPMGKELEGASQAQVLFTLTIDDPVKDAVLRNKKNKDHQEEMERMKKLRRERKEIDLHKKFLLHLDKMQNHCKEVFENEAGDDGPSRSRLNESDYVMKEIVEFVNHYEIDSLANPSDENVKKSMNIGQPPYGILYDDHSRRDFEDRLNTIGFSENKPENIPYHLGK